MQKKKARKLFGPSYFDPTLDWLIVCTNEQQHHSWQQVNWRFTWLVYGADFVMIWKSCHYFCSSGNAQTQEKKLGSSPNLLHKPARWTLSWPVVMNGVVAHLCRLLTILKYVQVMVRLHIFRIFFYFWQKCCHFCWEMTTLLPEMKISEKYASGS